MDRRLLGIYLNDHLALLSGASERARASAGWNSDNEVGESLCWVADEMADDEEALLRVMRRLGLRRSRWRPFAARVLEIAGRMKLNGRLVRYSPLSRLEELEFIACGVAVSAQVWETLEILRVEGGGETTVSERKVRARTRHEQMLQLRARWVRPAFDVVPRETSSAHT